MFINTVQEGCYQKVSKKLLSSHTETHNQKQPWLFILQIMRSRTLPHLHIDGWAPLAVVGHSSGLIHVFLFFFPQKLIAVKWTLMWCSKCVIQDWWAHTPSLQLSIRIQLHVSNAPDAEPSVCWHERREECKITINISLLDYSNALNDLHK